MTINFPRVRTSVISAAVAAPLLLASAHGAITLVSSGSHTQGNSSVDGTAGGPYNQTINAGASDFLIVGVSTELGGTSAYNVNYDGNAMTLVDGLLGGDLNQNKIYILDLTGTSYTGGNATLSFTWTATAGGDLGFGWVSLDGDLGAGESLAVVAKDDSVGQTGSNVELVTTTDTFNFANFNHNRSNSNGALSSNLTEVYRSASFGSNAGAAGYEQGATAGTHTYTWAATNPRSGTAIAIGVVIVPEPSSAALIGLGGLALILRRRK